jgi:hypothetical protein
VIYHSCEEGWWRQLLPSTVRSFNVCGRNLITGLISAASPMVDIVSTCKARQTLGVSLPLLTCSPLLIMILHSYCTAEFRIPRGTYELPCIKEN